MPKPLPDPTWADAEFCVCCGYSLTGLTPPSRCPECGTPFMEKQLVLHGVPRSMRGTPIGRRVAWVVLLVSAVGYVHVIGLIAVLSCALAVIVGVALVAALVTLLLTSRRERAGAERLVVSPVGVARLPLGNPKEAARLDSVIVPWGSATGVVLKRISPVWYQLRIGKIWAGGHVTDAILDAGIRCPDALASAVRDTIDWHLQRAREAPTPEQPSA